VPSEGPFLGTCQPWHRRVAMPPPNTKKKHKRKTRIKEEKTVSCTFDGNEYAGVLRQDNFGARYLAGSAEKYSWKDGVCYDGPFVASQVQGRGRLSWPDGSSYEGELSNGLRHGKGFTLPQTVLPNMKDSGRVAGATAWGTSVTAMVRHYM